MKKEKRADSISTFLGSDADVDGSIAFKGTLRVDGKIRGKITSSAGTLIVGEKASIDADVNVNVAIIMGELNGTIDAKDRIEVYPPGRVGGDIQAPVISIEPGGVFNGTCAMKTQTAHSDRPGPAAKFKALAGESKGK
jgi:cytoskeletal protein CcmA (bactofilin family)